MPKRTKHLDGCMTYSPHPEHGMGTGEDAQRFIKVMMSLPLSSDNGSGLRNYPKTHLAQFSVP
jgi:hypothetical protein